MRNPQAIKQIEELKKNNGDPNELIKQITGKYTPDQMQKFRQFANGFGFTDEQLNNFGITSK